MERDAEKTVWFDLTFSCADLLTYYQVASRVPGPEHEKSSKDDEANA